MQKIREMLMESIFEVFEKMFYVFLEPLDIEQAGYDMTASIAFQGTAAGEIRIFISKGLAEKMVKNMLNVGEEAVDVKLVEDCLKESANMICGNFLRKFDSSRVFNLSLPAFDGNAAVMDYRIPAPPLCLAFESEGEGIGVRMNITDQAS